MNKASQVAPLKVIHGVHGVLEPVFIEPDHIHVHARLPELHRFQLLWEILLIGYGKSVNLTKRDSSSPDLPPVVILSHSLGRVLT